MSNTSARMPEENGNVAADPASAQLRLSQLEQHKGWLEAVVAARLQESQAVEDVWQEIALAVVRSKSVPDEDRHWGPWLYRVAVRQALLYRRKAGRQRRLTQRYQDLVNPPEASNDDPLRWLLNSERDDQVRTALRQLPGRDREILLLKHGKGWTYSQLSEHLGLSRDAVEYRLLRARRRLRSVLHHELRQDFLSGSTLGADR